MSPTRARPVITLLTDYGTADAFVGVLHGVIARVCPDAHVIDLSHGVPRQDVRSGAAVLAQSLTYMPVGVHVAVVDPTVGSDRRAVALRLADGRTLVGPDNGLLWPAALIAGGAVQAVEISGSPWRLEPVAATFHGRDIFAPVAAHLAAGESLERAGEQLDPSELMRLDALLPSTDGRVLVVTVISADGFGNLQLAAAEPDLGAVGVALGQPLRLTLESGEKHAATYARTFSDVVEDELLLLEDSSRRLAIAVNRGSARDRLGLEVGDVVRIGAGRKS